MFLLLRGHVIAVYFLILFYVTGNKSALYKFEYLKDAEINDKFNKMLAAIANINEEKMNALKRYAELDNYSAGTGTLRDTDETKKDLVAILMPNNYHGQADEELTYEDDYSIITPKEIPVDVLLLMNGNHNSDNEEAKFQLRSLIAKLKNEAMRKNLDLVIDDTGSIPIETGTIPINTDHINIKTESIPGVPISSTVPVVRPRNEGNEIDLYHYKTKNGNKEIYDEALLMSEEQPDINFKTKDVLRMWKACSKKAKKMCEKACKGTYKKICKEYKCSSNMKKDMKKYCKSECKDKFDSE